jgi:NhaP-type Na+/H+ or K+/H+ antiporter
MRGGQSSQLMHRLKNHALTLEIVKGNERAEKALASIISEEAEELQRREMSRLAKKINGSNLTMAIIITVVSMAIIYGLANWTFHTWGQPLGWIPLVMSILLGAVLLLLTAAGFTTIYTPAKQKVTKQR